MHGFFKNGRLRSLNKTETAEKTIVYVGGFELPDRNAAAHRVLAVAKMFRACGYRVVLIGASRDTGGRSVLQTCTMVQGFACYGVPYPKGLRQWPAYLADITPVQQVIDAIGGADAVVCYNYPAAAFARLRQDCHRKGCRILADCTEWYNLLEVSPLFKLIKGTDTWLRMRVIQKHLDGMIVISRYLQRYYQACPHVAYLPPLVDTTDAKWNCEPKPRGREVTFVYLGNPGHKDKLAQILTAVTAAARQYPCRLWVIGANWQDFVRLNPDWQGQEPDPCVSFLGRLPHEESLAYLKSADCSFIIRDNTRTNNAGFPTKFVEAVTMGTDVIASDISDLRDYQDRVPGLYLTDDVEKTILQYAAEHTGKTGQKRPQTLFDYRNWLEEIPKLGI